MGDHDQPRTQASDKEPKRITTEGLFFPERTVPGGRMSLSQPPAIMHGSWLPAVQGTTSAAVAIGIEGLTNYGILWQGTVEKSRELQGGLTIESPDQLDSKLLQALGLYPLIIRFGAETLVIALPADAIKRIKDTTAPRSAG